jgi:hypothetical protein
MRDKKINAFPSAIKAKWPQIGCYLLDVSMPQNQLSQVVSGVTFRDGIEVASEKTSAA